MPSLLPGKEGSSASLHLHERSGQSDLPLMYYTLNTLYCLERGMNPVIPHLLLPQRDRQDSTETEKHNDFTKVPLKKKKAVDQIGEGGANSCSLFFVL